MTNNTARLARDMAHDLRGALHNLSMALEMAMDGVSAEESPRTHRYLTLAAEEASRLDRAVRLAGLWVRLLQSDVLPQLRPTGLDGLLKRCSVAAEGQGGVVLADPQLAEAAVDGLGDFLRTFGTGVQHARLFGEQGRLVLTGPTAWAPMMETVVEQGVPTPASMTGPVRGTIGLAVATLSCVTCGGTARTERRGDTVRLVLQWQSVA